MTTIVKIPLENVENVEDSDDKMSESTLESTAIKVGVSACLMGQKVRYNGGHTQSKLCLNTLTSHFEFRPFCPEVAAGFGTPRPTMRLVGSAQSPSLAWTKGDATDLSGQLRAGFQKELAAIGDLDGYIFMAKSPSCGLHRVKVYKADGEFTNSHSQGLYAEALTKRFPLLPVEDEGRLHDPHLRENFILRVYAYHNFKAEVLVDPSVKALVEFHKSYKYVLMAHSQATYKKLGRLLAQGSRTEIGDLVSEYFESFMIAISKPANNGNHANVLLHLLGYLKKVTPSKARQNIADIILKYRNGLVPLVTPMTLLNHYVQLHGGEYVRAQRYFQPYPEALCLTNSI